MEDNKVNDISEKMKTVLVKAIKDNFTDKEVVFIDNFIDIKEVLFDAWQDVFFDIDNK